MKSVVITTTPNGKEYNKMYYIIRIRPKQMGNNIIILNSFVIYKVREYR